jgi:hypothetical protein
MWWVVVGVVAWTVVAFPLAVLVSRRVAARKHAHPLVDDPRLDARPLPPLRPGDDPARPWESEPENPTAP